MIPSRASGHSDPDSGEEAMNSGKEIFLHFETGFSPGAQKQGDVSGIHIRYNGNAADTEPFLYSGDQYQHGCADNTAGL